MAEVERTLITLHDRRNGGECKFIAICEDTQTAPMPESGEPSPTVVRIRLVNTSPSRRGVGQWMHSNGDLVTGDILPGENQEISISPPRRVYLYELRYQLALAAAS
jgi:hypothetical protein